jgi:hypothetical protein
MKIAKNSSGLSVGIIPHSYSHNGFSIVNRNCRFESDCIVIQN